MVRKHQDKGVLPPTLKLSAGADTGLITPYYIPISDKDIIFKPKISFNIILSI